MRALFANAVFHSHHFSKPPFLLHSQPLPRDFTTTRHPAFRASRAIMMVQARRMASPAQIAANRRNALKSTGPKTARGKAIVSLNPVKHGFRSDAILLPGESPREFRRLLDSFRADYQPRHPAEEACVLQVAVAVWKTWRADYIETSICKLPVVEAIAQLYTLSRYRGTLQRSFFRALERIEALRAQSKITEQSQFPFTPLRLASPVLQSHTFQADGAAAPAVPGGD
jgi:hypothetical protein